MCGWKHVVEIHHGTKYCHNECYCGDADFCMPEDHDEEHKNGCNCPLDKDEAADVE